MKNFQNKTWSMWQRHIRNHPHPPRPPEKKIAFEDSKLLLELCLVDSRILYFWYVEKSIYKFIIKLDALQCLFLRGLD